MTEKFDAIVIGMGPGGEVAASRLLTAGRRVAVIERELIGGECYRHEMDTRFTAWNEVVGVPAAA